MYGSLLSHVAAIADKKILFVNKIGQIYKYIKSMSILSVIQLVYT